MDPFAHTTSRASERFCVQNVHALEREHVKLYARTCGCKFARMHIHERTWSYKSAHRFASCFLTIYAVQQFLMELYVFYVRSIRLLTRICC